MAQSLQTHPIHLGRDGTAIAQPEFTGFEWYQHYGERHGHEGADARLVSLFHFESSWDSWEMHPAGEEVVVCLEGSMTLIQELPDGEKRTHLAAGEYAINPRGVWHTADADAPVRALFITTGLGTENRQRT